MTHNKTIKTLRDLDFVDISTHPNDKYSDELKIIKGNDIKSLSNILEKETDKKIIRDYVHFAIIVKSSMQVLELLLQKLDLIKYVDAEETYEIVFVSFITRHTFVGTAIDHRNFDALKFLVTTCKRGHDINKCYRNTKYSEETGDGIAAYLDTRHYRDQDTKILSFIIDNGTKPHEINAKHIFNLVFNLAIHTSYDEFKMILDAGIDRGLLPVDTKAIHSKEYKSMGFHSPEVNLFDLVLMHAEFQNVFRGVRKTTKDDCKNTKDDCKNTKDDYKNIKDVLSDSIKKVNLVIAHGINFTVHNNCYGQNYLHRITIPDILSTFLSKVKTIDNGKTLNKLINEKDSTPYNNSPIALAENEDCVILLTKYGAVTDEASCILETTKHKENLQKNIPKAVSQMDLKSDINETNCLLEHVDTLDYSSLISLIKSGYNVNHQNKTSGWTVLHHVFSRADYGNISTNENFIHIMSKNEMLRFANILIKKGAKPLKDNVGRTPLMCLSFHAHNLSYVHQVINLYVDFEADYYELNRKEYRNKFIKLREGGFKSFQQIIGSSILVPTKRVFDEFWKSFKSSDEFNPIKSHDPVAEWNRDYELLRYQ
jgi:hypothetical protein